MKKLSADDNEKLREIEFVKAKRAPKKREKSGRLLSLLPSRFEKYTLISLPRRWMSFLSRFVIGKKVHDKNRNYTTFFLVAVYY